MPFNQSFQKDFRVQELPLARIKKIMKLDEDVKVQRLHKFHVHPKWILECLTANGRFYLLRDVTPMKLLKAGVYKYNQLQIIYSFFISELKIKISDRSFHRWRSKSLRSCVWVCVPWISRVKSNIHLEKRELKVAKRSELPCLPGLCEDKTLSDPAAFPAYVQLWCCVITVQLIHLNLWLVSI